MKRIAMLLGSLTLCCVFLLASCEKPSDVKDTEPSDDETQDVTDENETETGEDDEDLPFSYSYDTEAEFTTANLINGYPKEFQGKGGKVQKTVADGNVTYKITFNFQYVNGTDKGEPIVVEDEIIMNAEKESGAYTVTSVSEVPGCTENRAAVIKGSLDDEEFSLSYTDDGTAFVTAVEIKFTRKKD